MKGFVDDIEKLTLENSDFRRVLYTAHGLQLVVMAIQPGDEIGEETHEDRDQFFRVEAGSGEILIDGVVSPVGPDMGMIVPAGARHNVRSTGTEPLKLYTIYAPPEHRHGTVHATKAEADAALAETLRRVGEASRALLADADARGAALESQALAFAETLARKLAGAALDRFPMDAIAEVARQAFTHLRGVPHLVVRVNESLVDDVERMVKQMARERGFDGRLVVLGEPDIARGDARFEWADGGVVRDGAAVAAEVARSILDIGSEPR